METATPQPLPPPGKSSTRRQLGIAISVVVGLFGLVFALILFGQISVAMDHRHALREAEPMKKWMERINAFRFEHSDESLKELVTRYGSGLQIVPPEAKFVIFEPLGGNKFQGEDYVIEKTSGDYKIQVHSNGRAQLIPLRNEGF